MSKRPPGISPEFWRFLRGHEENGATPQPPRSQPRAPWPRLGWAAFALACLLLAWWIQTQPQHVIVTIHL